MTRDSQELNPVFPTGGSGSVFASSGFMVTLQNITSVKDENWLFLSIQG